jgi:CheY-like chemotaxis protein
VTATTKTILIVDDEPDVVRYLSAVLEDEGYEVLTAGSGQDGLQLARDRHPDLITLDVTMPGMSGIEVFTALRRDPTLEQIPVIIVTGVAKFRRLTEYRGVRAPDAFIPKPIDLPALLSSLSSLLDQ